MHQNVWNPSCAALRKNAAQHCTTPNLEYKIYFISWLSTVQKKTGVRDTTLAESVECFGFYKNPRINGSFQSYKIVTLSLSALQMFVRLGVLFYKNKTNWRFF